jgi:AcrR family transcriptional regulator
MSSAAQDRPVVDGRTARRDRNRDAVLAAMIALVTELDAEPAIEDVAARAGVSYRSVYRYFDDRTDLVLAAVARVQSQVWPTFADVDWGAGSFDDRVRTLIDTRLAAYRQVAPLMRIILRRAANEPLVLAQYDAVRVIMSDQLAAHFAPELAVFDAAERAVVFAALEVVFQFESFDFLARSRAMNDAQLAAVLERQVRAHLG